MRNRFPGRFLRDLRYWIHASPRVLDLYDPCRRLRALQLQFARRRLRRRYRSLPLPGQYGRLRLRILRGRLLRDRNEWISRYVGLNRGQDTEVNSVRYGAIGIGRRCHRSIGISTRRFIRGIFTLGPKWWYKGRGNT